MTDSTEQGASTTATEQQGVKLPNGYTRLPNGVILDKEGKPAEQLDLAPQHRGDVPGGAVQGAAGRPGELRAALLKAVPVLGLGKPIFDCDKWQERWVTGPKDGSCD
ncbi:unnamed protein product [Clonostachys rosea f. rosea IK726]|uniref:Uncharacterized protein n=1 Tax=Clonostachys rosea f. rosea IK726 TaxID=1349383 RepID=A0ACA9TKG1_BIOOC|nr:unnamed protein product [Clonostachys rosea f. rosea IK726]